MKKTHCKKKGATTMKKTKLRFDHFITLVEEGRLRVGRYEYTRNVDSAGNSHFYRTYRAGDIVINEEVTPFREGV